MAFAMAGLASQMCAVFAVAVALGGGPDNPRPREPTFTDRARRKGLARGRCAAIWPDLQLDLGMGRALKTKNSFKHSSRHFPGAP